MRQVGNQDNALQWDVFVTPSVPVVSNDLPPGQSQRVFSPISSTLVYGKRDAVLVDAPVTVDQSNALADWIASTGKNLTTVYASHGHGDHWFGFGTILERFPNARAVATPDVVRVMREQSSPEWLEKIWKQRFPGQIPERLVLAEEIQGDKIQLEGEELFVVEVGHSDTDHTTCLTAPSVGLVVAGDVAYNDVHQYLAESTTPEKRAEWLSALDKIESLKPSAVIAGHKRPGREDSPSIIAETRQYIRNFDRLDGKTMTAVELYEEMLKLYPNRFNPGALWWSARAAKG